MRGPKVRSILRSTRKHDNGKRAAHYAQGAFDRPARHHQLSRFCQPSVTSLSRSRKTCLLALE